MKRRNLQVGDRVRLKLGRSCRRGRRKVSIIERFLTDIEGGVIVADRLDGVFRYWNVEDLERVRGVIL